MSPLRQNKLRWVVLGAGPLWYAAAPALAEVIYVNAAAVGASTGTSWTDAYPSLQSALARAVAGDDVWVAAGVYRPAPPGGDRAASFAMLSGVGLYGGFAGTETQRIQRDWVAHVTTLSGDLNGDDGPEFANTSDNSHQVVVAVDMDSGAVLDGFTVTGARADGVALGATPESKDQGGGLNIYNGAPRIYNCTFARNWMANHGAVNDHGDQTRIANCTFRENYSAQFGAGLYIHHHSMTTATGCSFIDNVAQLEGAGAYSRSFNAARLEECLFMGNSATRGGGFYSAVDGTTTVQSCHFANNAGSVGGGGIYADFSSPVVVNCTFASNRAGFGVIGGGGGGGGSGGAGIWFSGGHGVVSGCSFTDNSGSFGSGVYNIELAATLVTGCTFIANHAEEAGGVYSLDANAVVEDCVFEGNTASTGQFSVGGGVSNYFGNMVVRRCTFVRNSADLGGGALYNEGDLPAIVDSCLFVGNTSFGPSVGFGGGVLNGYLTRTKLTNCLFIGNSANQGGAIHNIYIAEPTISNCTLVANSAVSPMGAGAMITYQTAAPIIKNMIAWGNGESPVLGPDATIERSCIEGGHAGVGNIASNPMFAHMPAPGLDGVWGTDDDDLGALSLLAGSPCIDAGDTGAVEPQIVLDLAGLPRIVDDPAIADTGAGGPPVIDIGAYEYQGAPCPANFDGLGGVDIRDIFAFLGAWFAADPRTDFNSNGTRDVHDIFSFLGVWFGGCP